MSPLKAAILALTALVLLPAAAAQDPTVNESDYNTTAPPGDESYLDESSNASTTSSDEPTVSEGDFDTSAPTGDEAYLDDGSEPTLSDSEFDMSAPAGDESYLDQGASGESPSRVPAPGVALALGAAVVAIALARRR